MTASLLPRHASGSLAEALDVMRVTLIHGPRQAGKTTLARLTCERIGGTYATLDDHVLLAAARNDPEGFVAQPRPLVIDEVQRAGDRLIRAIKMAVDLDPIPGQFLVTGSTNFLTVPNLAESLAGRVGIVELCPLSQGELARSGPETFTRLAFDNPDALRSGPAGTHSRNEYLTLICVGGFPAIRDHSPTRRRRWHRDYLHTVIQRDIVELSDIRRSDAMTPVLGTLAALTGQELNIARLARRVGLDPRTVDAYLAWLDTFFLIHRVPRWSRNLSAKASRATKLYLSDSGLAATLTNKDPAALARPTDTSVGGLVETFAANEIAKQLTWDDTGARLHHFRDRDGPEIDLILERPDGRVVAIEVKTAMSPGFDAFRWLAWLRDRLDRIGTDFVHGFVLHTGPNRLSFGDRLTLLPLDALWTPAGALRQSRSATTGPG